MHKQSPANPHIGVKTNFYSFFFSLSLFKAAACTESQQMPVRRRGVAPFSPNNNKRRFYSRFSTRIVGEPRLFPRSGLSTHSHLFNSVKSAGRNKHPIKRHASTIALASESRSPSLIFPAYNFFARIRVKSPGR